MGNDTAKLSPTVMQDLVEKTTFEADEIHNFYREFEKGCAPGNLAMKSNEFTVNTRYINRLTVFRNLQMGKIQKS
jgi:hypothetical protein